MAAAAKVQNLVSNGNPHRGLGSLENAQRAGFGSGIAPGRLAEATQLWRWGSWVAFIVTLMGRGFR